MFLKKYSFIKATNQTWKLYLGYFFILIGAAIVFIISNYNDEINYLKNLKAGTWALFLGLGFIILFTSFAWMCVSIKCPSCKAKLFWYAVSCRDFGDSLEWVDRFRRCPVCKANYSKVINHNI